MSLQASPPYLNSLSNNLKSNFDKIWTNLQNKSQNGTLLSGSEVKKLYQTAANRTSLAEAWTLCSRSIKGYLTKGEFFAFTRLIAVANQGGQLPKQLGSDLEKLIQKINVKGDSTPNAVQQALPVPIPKNDSAYPFTIPPSANNNRLTEDLKARLDKVKQLRSSVERSIIEAMAAEAQQKRLIDAYDQVATKALEIVQSLEGQAQVHIREGRQINARLHNSLQNTLNTYVRNTQYLNSLGVVPVASQAQPVPPPQKDVSRAQEQAPTQYPPEHPPQPTTTNPPPPTPPQPTITKSIVDAPLSQDQLQALQVFKMIRPSMQPDQLAQLKQKIRTMPEEELEAYVYQAMAEYEAQQAAAEQQQLQQLQKKTEQSKDQFADFFTTQTKQNQPASQQDFFA